MNQATYDAWRTSETHAMTEFEPFDYPAEEEDNTPERAIFDALDGDRGLMLDAYNRKIIILDSCPDIGQLKIVDWQVIDGSIVITTEV